MPYSPSQQQRIRRSKVLISLSPRIFHVPFHRREVVVSLPFRFVGHGGFSRADFVLFGFCMRLDPAAVEVEDSDEKEDPEDGDEGEDQGRKGQCAVAVEG
jgi:hypothetical protein